MTTCASRPPEPADNGPILHGAYDGRPDAQVRYFQLFNEVIAAAMACGGLRVAVIWANCLQAMGVPHAEWAEPDHPGYSARFTHVIQPDYPLRPELDWSDAVWRTAGDTLPFLARR